MVKGTCDIFALGDAATIEQASCLCMPLADCLTCAPEASQALSVPEA